MEYKRLHGTLSHFQYLISVRNSVILELIDPCSSLHHHVIVPNDLFSNWRSNLIIGRYYTITDLQQQLNGDSRLIAHVSSQKTALVAEDGFVEGVADSPPDRHDLCSYQGEVTAVDDITGECQLDGNISWCLHCSLGHVVARGLPSVGDLVWISSVHWLEERRSLVGCIRTRFRLLNRRGELSVSNLSSVGFLSMCTLFEYSIPASGLPWFRESFLLVESIVNSQCRWSRRDVLKLIRRLLSQTLSRCGIDEIGEFTSRPHSCKALCKFPRPFALISTDDWLSSQRLQFGSDCQGLSTAGHDSDRPWLLGWLRPNNDGSWSLLGKNRNIRVLLSPASLGEVCLTQLSDDESGSLEDDYHEQLDRCPCRGKSLPGQMWLLAISNCIDISSDPDTTATCLFIHRDHVRLLQPHSCGDRSGPGVETRLLVLARTLLTGFGQHRRFFLHVQLSTEHPPPAVSATRVVVLISGDDLCLWYSLLSAGSAVTVTVSQQHGGWLLQRVRTVPGVVSSRFPDTSVYRLPASAYCRRDIQNVGNNLLQQSVISIEALLSSDRTYCSGDLVDVTGHLVTRSEVKQNARQTLLVLCDCQRDALRLAVYISERVSNDLPQWIQPGLIMVLRGVRVSARKANTNSLPADNDVSVVLEEMSDVELVDWRPVGDRSLRSWTPKCLPHVFTSRITPSVSVVRWSAVASVVEVLSASVTMHCPLCDRVIPSGGVCSFVGCHAGFAKISECRCSARARVLLDDGSGCVAVHVRDRLLFALLGHESRLKARALARGSLSFSTSSSGDQLLSALCMSVGLVSRPLLWSLKQLPIRSGYDKATVFCESLAEVTNDVMAMF